VDALDNRQIEDKVQETDIATGTHQCHETDSPPQLAYVRCRRLEI